MKNKNTSLRQLSLDYERVEKAIEFIEINKGVQQPSLSRIAESVNLSEFHFQRLFSRWVGISPKRFMQFITKEHAKKLLQDSRTLLDVTYDSGLSSLGRLHDLFVKCEAVTPGEYKAGGNGLVIRYGFTPSPFGRCLIASTDKGVCSLKFVKDNRDNDLVQWLGSLWPNAQLKKDTKEISFLAARIFSFGSQERGGPVHVFVKGTNFQIKVWEALLMIPLGKAVTYEDIATHIGLPGATRAVGTAIGKNPIPFLIPCHRVIRKMGDFGNYGEGTARKKAILGFEAAMVSGDGKGK